MLTSIDNFLKINFEISLETSFRLTDSKLKEMLKAEIKNFWKSVEIIKSICYISYHKD